MNPVKEAAKNTLLNESLPLILQMLEEINCFDIEDSSYQKFKAATKECISLLGLTIEEDLPAKDPGETTASDEISDEDAMKMLEEMEGTNESSGSSEPKDLSDEEAMKLLEEMESPNSDSVEVPSSPMKNQNLNSETDNKDEESDKVEEIDEWVPNDFQTDPDMIKDFIENTDELMENLNDSILKLEDNPEEKEIIEEIFRSAHTLKGASGMFGFSAIERIVHKMENLFDLVRKNKLVPNSSIIDVVFQGVDILKPLLEAVKNGKPCNVKTAAVVKNLILATNGKYTPETKSEIAPAKEEKCSPEPEKKGSSEEKKGTPKPANQSSTIRVDLNRLDDLVNLIGELVTDRTRFTTIEEDIRSTHPGSQISAHFSETVQLFGRHMNEIQEIIMKVRMVPIGNAFNKFTRIVRDLSRSLDKKIDLEISGENAELDKTLVEQIGDPLIHLIRNSCDHGIELPEDRKNSGKSETGKISLSAHQDGNHIVITIKDDGKGMCPEVFRKKGIEKGLISEDDKLNERDIFNLIFEPGFSTAESVSNISGRGVGMDVVKKQILKLKGMIEIDSKKGLGTTISIRLPLTLAIVQSLLVGTKDEKFAIPLSSVVESIRIKPMDIQKIGDAEVIKLRNKVLPLLHLEEVLCLAQKKGSIAEFIEKNSLVDDKKKMRVKTDRFFVVVVGHKDRPFGLIVDQLLNQQEMVIKSMGTLMKNIPCVAGGAVMGNGEVVLVLDIPEMEYSYSAKTRAAAM